MANVKLSPSEFELVTNAHFILTKNRIVAKVYHLFGELATAYSDEIKSKNILPDEVLIASPKISKGENYEGLPWVMLDYPRCFTKEDAFAVRCFFWWGNFCSISLQLKGIYKQRFKGDGFMQKAEGMRLMEEDEWFLCCNTNEWQHHFREDNYKPLSLFSPEEMHALPFIKLAKKIPLQEWDNLEYFFTTSFKKILQHIASTA